MQSRRKFLQSASVLLSVPSHPGWVFADVPACRRLRFEQIHTHEKLDVCYYELGQYLPDALAEINHLLRDFRTRESKPIDVHLLDYLAELYQATESSGVFQIISAYRSPATNEQLRNTRTGIDEHSLHMEGRAIDVRLTDVPTQTLKAVAISLERGGVGYYAVSNFVHLDTGPVRSW
jgi:uncharacterized protein YcbK (DUF882 family)